MKFKPKYQWGKHIKGGKIVISKQKKINLTTQQ